MRSICLTVVVVAIVAFLGTSECHPDEPPKSTTPAADPMLGKEPGQVRDDNGLKMNLVWCPSGEFKMMGSPASEEGRERNEDQVEVTMTNGFWLGKYEVTQVEWTQLMGTEPWKGEDFTKAGDDFPATNISWDDAMAFCRKLTKQERKSGRLPADWEYTLPTEAQWERACRARTETKFSFGDNASKLGEYAWFEDNLAGEQFAHRVGQKKPNPWGLFDMHGNVWEWCRDYYAKKLPGGRDPEVKVAEGASNRVVRGGGFDCDASLCRSAIRGGIPPEYRNGDYGFRIARSSVQPAK